MDELTSTAGIVALAAAGCAAVALVAVAVLALRLRRLRAAQGTVLGDGSTRDVVEHAAALARELEQLRRSADATDARLAARLDTAERRLDTTVAHTAVVRYDALGELGGMQSSSVALLDEHRNGVVLSSILHREQARLYAKPVVDGRSELALSPEEEEAVAQALGGRTGPSG